MIPFGCTTNNGVSVMNAEPSIKCMDSDPTFVRMRKVGSTALVVYGMGVPVVFSYILWRYRKEITADQVLRAKGEGETSLTNPNIQIRRRFRKLYEDYKPEHRYWKLVLIARKLGLAIIGIMLAGNAALQVRSP